MSVCLCCANQWGKKNFHFGHFPASSITATTTYTITIWSPGPIWPHLVLHLLCVLYLYLSFLHPSFYLSPPLFNSLIKLKAKTPSLVFFFLVIVIVWYTHIHTCTRQIFKFSNFRFFRVFSLFFFSLLILCNLIFVTNYRIIIIYYLLKSIK